MTTSRQQQDQRSTQEMMAFVVTTGWTSTRPNVLNSCKNLHKIPQIWGAGLPNSRKARLPSHTGSVQAMAGSTNAGEKALIFDCDGVIVESEELHRVSYNKCWASADLGFEWSYEFYEKLQNSIGGGKEKMRWYFNSYGWPDGQPNDRPDLSESRDALIAQLHVSKTDMYQELIRDGQAKVRPGVLRLMDEAHVRGLRTAICSASNARAVRFVLQTLVEEPRLSRFDVILAGDDVTRKKPDPMIYNVARERLGVRVEDCVVIEDTQIGLQAAKDADMKVVITYTPYTATQQFDGAEVVLPSLGDESKEDDTIVTVDMLFPELATASVRA